MESCNLRYGRSDFNYGCLCGNCHCSKTLNITSMKILKFLLGFWWLTLNLSALALPTDCMIAPNETRSADQFLSDCSTNTIGVDPTKYAGTMDGTKQQIIDIANGVISF